MDTNRKRDENSLLDDVNPESRAKNQLPEWHPFAVWRTQIQNDQTAQTGSHPVLSSFTR